MALSNRPSISCALRVALLLAAVPALGGCAALAAKVIGGTVESLGVSVAADDDPQLIADAMPIGLKLVESGLVKSPRNPNLLLSACRVTTQYAQAFVAEPADYLEATDLDRARRDRERAGRLFLRARSYCLRALDVRHPGTAAALATSPAALEALGRRDAELLYWTAASWAAAIGVSRSNFDLVADLGAAHRIARRADALDPALGGGAVHELLIVLEAALAPASGGSLDRARAHFSAAREASHGTRVGPLVALAECVSVKEQNSAEFRELLARAIAFDADSAPEARLANTLAKRRARWLLGRAGDLFVEEIAR